MPPSWSETSDRATLHHMLSKKIAQLTKVIYHLNTKNEDQETRLVDLQQRYETEIEKMEADAASKLKELAKDSHVLHPTLYWV